MTSEGAYERLNRSIYKSGIDYMKQILCISGIAVMLGLLSCRSAPESLVQSPPSVSEQQERTYASVKRHSFICDGDTVSIRSTDFHTYLSNNVRSCLCDNAFNSKVTSKSLAAFMHLEKDYTGYNRFCSFKSKLRGEMLFETILLNANNFNCAEEEYGFTFYLRGYSNFYPMIKTIDDMSPQLAYNAKYKESSSVFKNNHSELEYAYLFSPFARTCYDESVAIQKYEYDFFLKAWQEGRIVLKEFGEE